MSLRTKSAFAGYIAQEDGREAQQETAEGVEEKIEPVAGLEEGEALFGEGREGGETAAEAGHEEQGKPGREVGQPQGQAPQQADEETA